MSAPLGPRGGPAAPPAAAVLPEMPDLSHLTEEERKIILAVMDRQKQEEEKEQSMLKKNCELGRAVTNTSVCKWFPFSGITELVNNVLQPQQKSQNEKEPETRRDTPSCCCVGTGYRHLRPRQQQKGKLHQQFEMYKDQVKKMGEEAQLTQEQKGDAPTCGICHKTKFADGCGHICSYCQTKFCARCGGRVSLRSNKVIWVCNLCRKQQEILTKSGAWFYSSGAAQWLLMWNGAKFKLTFCSEISILLFFLQNWKRSPSASRDPNQKYDQREERGDHSQYAPVDAGMPRSPSDYGEREPRRAPRSSRMYEDADVARGEYRDRRGRRRSQEYPLDEELDGQQSEYERQRQREEEYQARYRSDPNLARYPVKPQPYEEQMRIHAEVSRARHERRHSDVSLAYTELDEPQGTVMRGDRPSRQRSVSERRMPMESQRSYSMERTREAPGPGQRTSNHSPPTPHRSPVLGERSGDMRRGGGGDPMRKQQQQQQHHLDPSSAVRKTKREKMETMLRNDSLSSDQSESIRPPPPKPHKTKKGGKMRQVSLSSSEEELATTPEYTSCDDVEIESESVSEKGSLSPCFISHHPVTWQPSKDGDRLIGRILLNKRLKDGSVPRDSGALLGLKVVGGKMTESGRLCAFITKVKKGSLADTVGHLRPGDQVLEWNGRHLQGATFKEVYNIILESKPEPQVELVVSRPVKLWYDKVGHQLIVTILGAKDLPSREDGRPRNPYVKIYFLPDRSDKSKRRTKTVKKTLEPKWNQTFMYSPVHRREFRERMLEITLWDQARVREEESEFLGEILIELETALLDDEPHWYKLQTHDVSSMPLPHPSPYMPRRQLHGESPTRRLQRSQRISDSEISDYDCDDGIGVVSDYRHNGRDLQSSTLSVPEQVMSSNHCSRSGSPHRGDSMGRTRSRSPSVPPPQSLDQPSRGSRSSPTQYNTVGRMERHRMADDHYSPDSQYLTLPRSRHSQPIEHHHKEPRLIKALNTIVSSDQTTTLYPMIRRIITMQDIRNTNDMHYMRVYKMLLSVLCCGTFRRVRWEKRVPNAYDETIQSPESGVSLHPKQETAFPPIQTLCNAKAWCNVMYCAWSRNCEALDRHEYQRSRSADQRPVLERTTSRSRSTERPDSNLMRSMPSLPSGRSAPPSPALTRTVGPTKQERSWRLELYLIQHSSVRMEDKYEENLHFERARTFSLSSLNTNCFISCRAHPRSGSVQTSPTSTPMAGRRGRQLPQLPPKGTLERRLRGSAANVLVPDTTAHLQRSSAMDVEERTRQMKLKMNKYKQGAGSDSRLEQDYHSKAKKSKLILDPQNCHKCFVLEGRDPQRGSDNISTKSSDSDVSDVVSRPISLNLIGLSTLSVASQLEQMLENVSLRAGLSISQSAQLLGFSRTTISRVYKEWARSSRSTTSQRCSIGDFTSKMKNRQMGAPGKNMTKSTSIGGDMYTLEKNDGSQSDTAVGTVGTGGKKRRSSIGAKMVAIVGLSRKSRSTSQLSQTGRNHFLFSSATCCLY
ncbi:RIMS2 protein, partial [Amia calva]|nr:RIMS2 protein [Amia calva]